ncbi:MAG: hypothetical protein HY290_25960 [Planctomycetia bacterium]|nr:hypothetical protein [Planctomycetia bacterium]
MKSQALPRELGDVMQAYVCRHGNGHWFVWEAPPEKSGDGDVDTKPIAGD